MSHVVLGGGLAGLATAHYLIKQAGVKRVILLESSHRLGGWIDTTRHSDGVLYEHGPRTVRPAGPQGANTLALVQELGLTDRVRAVKYGHPSTVNRLIYSGGSLHKLPSSLLSVFRTLSPFTKPLAAAALTDLAAPRVKCDDTPLFQFISRRFGEEVAMYAVDPLVRGICAGNSREISVHFIAKYLHQLEQESGSVLKGYAKDYIKSLFRPETPTEAEQTDLVRQARSERWAVWGLENGISSLIEALAEAVKDAGVEIFTDFKLEHVHASDGSVILSGSGGATVTCHHLTLATPAHAAAQLTKDLSPSLSFQLAQIPYVDVAVTNLEFKGDVLSGEAFGFLVPSHQPQPILGCIYDTCTFRQGNRTILTVMMGGAWFDSVIGQKSEAEIEETAVKTITSILGIRDRPVRSVTKILRKCIAQYTVGHNQRVQKARQIIKSDCLPLSLVGSSYDGVGINDTILSAKQSATTYTL